MLRGTPQKLVTFPALQPALLHLQRLPLCPPCSPQLPDGSPPSAQDVQDVLPHLTPKQLAEAVWSFAKHEVKPTQVRVQRT